MSISRNRHTLVVALLCAVALSPSRGLAQVVASTFGPSDSYNMTSSWAVETTFSSEQSVAQRFTYAGGPGFTLAQIRLALIKPSSVPSYTVKFWIGDFIGGAFLLESWSFAAPSDGIYTLLSVATPELITGDSYWISASSSGVGGWNKNDQFLMGTARTGAHDPSWFSFGTDASAAYDVTVRSTAAVVPEPATFALLATGLLGVGLVARRRAAT